MSVRSTTLPNGMTVLTDNMPHLESASLGIWVKAGSRSETELEDGISHVLEHMAFKGTTTRSSLEIATAIEDVGGDLNAATSVEHTGYFARVLKEDVGLAGDILSDILQNSLFDQEELDREQHVIIQEIGASRDNPDDHVFDLFQQAAFPAQPIGRTILGTIDSVNSFGPDSIRAYMDRNYVGDRMVICAAGNVDHDALVDIANDRFHALRPGGAPEPVKAKYIGGEERLLSDHEQAHIILGLEGRAYNSDGFYAAQILASILGGGMSSRLFQEIREKRGLCYSVSASYRAEKEFGLVTSYVGTTPERAQESLDVLHEQLLAMQAGDVTHEELERARIGLKSRVIFSGESTGARASSLIADIVKRGSPRTLAQIAEQIDAVDLESFNDYLRKRTLGEVTIQTLGPTALTPPC